jgi:phosphoenolpyruvate---glycerone phosphotransferase subunit DhaL
MGLTAEWALRWARRSAEVIGENRSRLTNLDREIGDGDHGENLDRGFRAVVAKLDGEPPGTPGAVLKTVATTLISTVGGASGPLLGTAYLKAAGAAGDAAELDGPAVAAVLAAARDGVVARGKAETGDKTMVDAWTPAVDVAAAAAERGAEPAEVLQAAADAARAGAESTDPLVARKGRASYLGERSAGHRDPGAESSALLLAAAAEVAKG